MADTVLFLIALSGIIVKTKKKRLYAYRKTILKVVLCLKTFASFIIPYYINVNYNI
jgi:hypothetical protein